MRRTRSTIACNTPFFWRCVGAGVPWRRGRYRKEQPQQLLTRKAAQIARRVRHGPTSESDEPEADEPESDEPESDEPESDDGALSSPAQGGSSTLAAEIAASRSATRADRWREVTPQL